MIGHHLVRNLLLMPLLALSAALAQAGFRSVESGTLLLASPKGEPEPRRAAPTLDTSVDIRVTGPLARVRVEQRFRNPGDQWTEAVYLFPLPETAAVDRMRLRVGERTIKGEIRERKAARREYEQASREGKRASLARQQRPNLFTTRVANIPPGGTLEVTIEYQQAVTKDGDQYSLRFPMTLTPRYIPGSPLPGGDDGGAAAPDTHRVPDASAITSPRGLQGENHHPTRLTLDLRSGFPLAAVTSLHHPVNGENLAPDHRRVHLDAGAHGANRDFVLRWQPAAGAQPQSSLFTESLGDETYSLLMLSPPDPDRLPAPDPRELILVIDTSGSMGGESLRQAKRAVLWTLNRLRPQDRFDIVEFNSATNRLFGTPRKAGERQLRRARHFVRGLRARGGTEMRPALETALCGGCGDPESLRQVIFLTDGAIGNEEELFRVIDNRLGDSRLFTVGIGSAPNTWFMRKAAQNGRGTFTYIGDPERAANTMAGLFRRLESPLLTDIRLESGDTDLRVLPRPVPDLYAGEPVLLRLRGALPGQLTLTGELGGKPWRSTLDTREAIARPGIHAYWGRQRIESLLDRRRFTHKRNERDDLRQQVLDTALHHHLVSPFTSLVAVDRTPVKPQEATGERHLMANNSPAGTRFGLAPTATPAVLRLLLGVALLVAGGGLLWLQRGSEREDIVRGESLMRGRQSR